MKINWLDETKYIYKHANEAGWECLRHNKHYLDDYQIWINESTNFDKLCYSLYEHHEGGFIIPKTHREKFANDYQPLIKLKTELMSKYSLIRWHNLFDPKLKFEQQTFFRTLLVTNTIFYPFKTELLPNNENEFVFKFDASKPKAQQFANASKIFDEVETKSINQQKMQKQRFSLEKIGMFLRVFDAVQQGVSYDVICANVFPKRANTYPEY